MNLKIFSSLNDSMIKVILRDLSFILIGHWNDQNFESSCLPKNNSSYFPSNTVLLFL